MQLERNDISTTGLEVPFNDEVYQFLQSEKSRGRKVILDTSEPRDTVSLILHDEQLFDEIIDTTQDPLSGDYDYIGNGKTGKKAWEGASKQYLVGATNDAAKSYAGVFQTRGANAKTVIKAIRSYQWLKNLLVFVPLITSQQFTVPGATFNSFIMFCCFCLVASFGYIVNDLLDLQSDRAHPTKHRRPFASGDLGVTHGIVIGTVLLLLAALGCYFLPTNCTVALLCYLFLTLAYSFYLKTKLMVDVVALGGLFTLRVIGGAEAIESELSFYLLSFSIFLFSSLGMIKRYAELHNLKEQNKLAARGRGYRVEDMAPVRIIGISLGYMSVFIMGLYVNSPVITQYYSNTKVIWLLFPLLTYWLGRLWILANRGEVNEDPLIFTVKDRTSLLVAAMAAAILVLAN